MKIFLNRNKRAPILTIFLYITIFLTFIYPFVLPRKAEATITQSFVRIDRLGTGEDISGSACMETVGSHGTETNVTIVFPADWTISTTASDWVANNTNLPYDPPDLSTQATMWSGVTNTEQAATVIGKAVTWTATDLSDNTFYCFNFSGGASSDVGAAGNDKRGYLQTQGGSPFVSNVDWSISVVTADSDQITVTASVSAQMTFSLSANTASLGTLSPSTTNAASGITQTVTTNARNGWASWVKSGSDGGATAGALESVNASSEIDSPGSWDGTPETLTTSGGYVLDIDTGTGCDSTCVANEYEGATADAGGHLSYNIFRQTANDTTPTSNDQISLVVKARSSATTPAASDYTDTLTINAAGSF